MWFYGYKKLFLTTTTLLIKHEWQKIKKIPHTNHSNHLAKFLQDGLKHEKVGALRVNTGFMFFMKILLTKVSKLALTYRVIIVNNVYKAYCVNVAVNIKPNYLNKHMFSRVSLQ